MRHDQSEEEYQDWNRYRMTVVDGLRELKNDTRAIKEDITELKIRIGTWGALFGFAGGCVSVVVGFLVHWFK